MKRYLILTYTVEFDRVHYPLPLAYEEDPNPAALKATIRRLRQVSSRALKFRVGISFALPLTRLWDTGIGHHTFRVKRSEEHTSELQSLMRISYDVFCLKKKKT